MSYDRVLTRGVSSLSSSFSSGLGLTGVFTTVSSNRDTGVLQQQSFMQQLLPQASFEPPAVAANLTFDVNRVARGLDGKQAMASTIRSENNAVKADLQQNWDSAKAELAETISGAAIDMGMNPGDALMTLMPQEGASKLGVMATIGGDLAFFGAGSFITYAQASATAMGDFKEQAKKLKPGEAEALMEEVHARLVARMSDPVAAAPVTLMPGQNNQSPQAKDGYQWNQMTPRDLTDFAAAKLEDQPEWKALEQVDFALDGIDKNHDFIDGQGTTIEEVNRAFDSGSEQAVLAVIRDVQDPEISFAAVEMHTSSLADVKGARSTGFTASPEVSGVLARIYGADAPAPRQQNEFDPRKMGLESGMTLSGAAA